MWKSRFSQDLNSKSAPAHLVPSRSSESSGAGTAGNSPLGTRGLPRWLKPKVWLLAFMLVLALIGMGIAQAYANRGYLVWSLIVIIYGGISLWLGWRHAKAAGKPFWPAASLHLAHWFGLFLFLKVLFVLELLGFVNQIVVGNIDLLMLGLGCYFAGIHLEAIFLGVSLFLAAMVYVDAYLTENVWLILTLILTFLALAAVIAVEVLHRSMKSKKIYASQVSQTRR